MILINYRYSKHIWNELYQPINSQLSNQLENRLNNHLSNKLYSILIRQLWDRLGFRIRTSTSNLRN